MKLYKTVNLLMAATAFLITLSFSSCDKDNNEDNNDNTPNFILTFANHYGTDHIHDDDTYTKDGRNIQFTRVEYYISGIVLSKEDGSEVSYDNLYLLNKLGNVNSIDLGDIEIGHYHALKFNVGIDSITNHKDPANYGSSSPLSPQSPSMHWSWNSGYRFIAIEGKMDASATPDSTLDGNFEYHIGTDDFYTVVELALHDDAEPGSDLEIDIMADFEIMLSGLTLPGDSVTHTMDNMTVANRIGSNIAAAFSKE